MKAGWEARSIASFAKTGAGGTPKKGTKAFYEGGDIPWLLSGEVANANIMEAKNFITEEGLKGSSAKLFPANSILVAMYGATAGEAGILRFEAATNQAVCAVLPSDQHIPEYLYYYLLHAKASLVAQAVGNAQPNISQAKIKSLEIPLPPLEEQQRIAAVLAEAFEGLAFAHAHAEANLKNAQELIEAGLGAAFSPEAAERNGWGFTDLRSLADVSYGYTTKAQSEPIGPRFLRITDIQDGIVDWDKVPYCDAPPEDYERYRVIPGDIVFARTGATTGKSYLLTEDIEAVAASYLIRLRLTSSALKPEYLSLFFQSDVYWKTIRAGISGSTQGGFNASKLGELVVPVPPIVKQDEVILRLKEIQMQASRLAILFRKKLQDLDDLRQSLLQKAFAGELT